MKRISFFIPHKGCPHTCSFCNQHSISGQSKAPTLEEMEGQLKTSLKGIDDGRDVEIAFFGGSFTALPFSEIQGYLELATKYVKDYGLHGIRFSTRPDAISPSILSRLKPYPVCHIELGAQSMDPLVLEANERGHGPEDTQTSGEIIKEAGIGLTLQMMMGLYKDSPQGAHKTAEALADLQPDSVRIYPTVVLRNTQLAQWYKVGLYTPLSIEEAVEQGTDLLRFFNDKNIPVIRLGLQGEASLEENLLAGPYHPAFGELCQGLVYYRQVLAELSESSPKETLYLNPRELSKVTGHGGWLLKKFKEQGLSLKVKAESSIPVGAFRLG